MATKITAPSAEAQKVIDTLKSNPGRKFSWAELCEAAGVENKTGYLTAVKKALGDGLVVGDKDIEVVVATKRKVNSYTFNEPVEE